MKTWLCLMLIFSTLVAIAEDPNSYLKNFDAKIYSLKAKGVKDFVVDIESSKLTKQMNDEQIFGRVKELIFRTYWTANPERVAIEVIGLPEGFKEVKEELKASLLNMMDNLIPLNSSQRFPGYKFISGPGLNEITAKDTTGIAPIPSFLLKFDKQDRLTEIIGQKPIGTLEMKPIYEKESFSDGKWVLKEMKTRTSESGQELTVTKDLDYGQVEGMGVLQNVVITTEQKSLDSKSRPVTLKESIEFKNYKINDGEALKYFLGEGTKESAKTRKKK